jgi:hypothetical protein
MGKRLAQLREKKGSQVTVLTKPTKPNASGVCRVAVCGHFVIFRPYNDAELDEKD